MIARTTKARALPDVCQFLESQMRRLILIGLLSGCASAGSEDLARPAPDAPAAEVFFTPPPWAYRLGPELYAAAGADSAQVRAELTRKASALGCHAVVSVTLPQNNRANQRPWGFCAWRIEPVKGAH